ncbi:MAG TPA: hypothetical protein VFJ71_04845 [Candidatus Limnocylindrales bacterium]|nr:hypothetical protein [Candidatus Limnocylindrales bacterium]
MPSSSILPAGRVAGVLIATLVAVGSAAAPPVAQAASCPSLPVSVEDLVALQRQDGPLAKAFSLGVTPMNERALACFGSREITLSAFVNRPDGLGGTSSFAITPSWIVGGGLIVFGSPREVSPGFGDGPFFFVSTRPSAGDLQHQYARRWVTIRGHFDDPAAATCRATGPAGVTPSRTQAVEICRTMFVLTSIRTPAAPDTATSPPSTARSTPSSSPALWLGGLVGALVAAAVIRRSDTDRRSRRGSR